VTRQSAQEIVDKIEALPGEARLLILSPLVRARKGTHQTVLEEIRKTGFVRARVDGRVYELDEDIQMDRYKIHTVEAVVDRLVIRHPEDEEQVQAARSRLTDSIETALKFGDGYMTVHWLNPTSEDADPFAGTGDNGKVDRKQVGKDILFSEHLACPEHGSVLTEVEPRTFSFNTPHGACPECQGLGGKLEIAADLLIPDSNLSLNQGAITVSEWSGPREEGGYYWQALEAVAQEYDIDLGAPVRDLPAAKLDLVLNGTKGKRVTVHYRNRDGRQATFQTAFEGVIGNLQRRYRETNSEYIRDKLSEYMNEQVCPTCKGARLRKEALHVTVGDVNIIEVTRWHVLQTLEWVRRLCGPDTPLNSRQKIIAERVLKEVQDRLGFLVDVGLDYLTLDRSAASLSGGEAQRIRLATQIGSRLMGVLYVLDEPSIGLHPRDNDRLLRTLEGLRDLGNTVMVVEHDADTIRTSDWVIDLGPRAGEQGGWIVAEGTVEQILETEESLTGAYLSGKLKVPIPEERRIGNGKTIRVIGARQNNLKNIDVTIPLGKLVCITGVSGSGKSTLMVEILYKALARQLNRARTQPGDYDHIEGVEQLDKVISIDQTPIGRTPRSNPGTYTGLFDHVRSLFAELPESKIRGYKPGRFSFNVHGGRCEACQGHGQLRIEMQFMPDVYVPCDVCHGARFNRETLQVRFKGLNIAEVLELTVDGALELFAAFPKMVSRLQTLQDVGLGYIRIGQPAPTLSGGEAQRVKLSRELSKRSTGRTLYVLDEPSVGLHAADVHKLIEVLQRLVDSGNTVLIIEHNLDIIKVADHIIDLGPEGGDRGGYIVAEGTPEEVCALDDSCTGQHLRPFVCVKAGS
jgi:excinuclease ABC subunit A